VERRQVGLPLAVDRLSTQGLNRSEHPPGLVATARLEAPRPVKGAWVDWSESASGLGHRASRDQGALHAARQHRQLALPGGMTFFWESQVSAALSRLPEETDRYSAHRRGPVLFRSLSPELRGGA